VLQTEIAVHPHSRLRAKVFVFRKRSDLHRFWKDGLGKTAWTERLGRRCVGAVNVLSYQSISFKDGKESHPVMVVDPRYFCVIGLVQGYLGMEIITHESTHAGFAYARRCMLRNMWGDIGDFEDEQICYPTGRIANEILRALNKAGVNK
jgi:hypothetical protein